MTGYGGRKREDPDYGMGECTIDLTELSLISEEELTARLFRAFEAPDYRPPRLPQVATELMALSQNPDVEFDDIEKLLEQDAMLTGEILSLARSAFYSRTHQVSGLRAALVLIGLKKLGQVVMQAALDLKVFRSKAYQASMERLKDHCRATAHLSRIISLYTPIEEEQAFLCGLLHDVGFAGVLVVLGQVERGQTPPDLAALWPAISAVHAKAGARMAELWGLPPEIAMAVGAHHQVSIEGFDHPLAATVCLGEALCSELEMTFVPGRRKTPAGIESASLQGGSGIDQSAPAIIDRAKEALAITDQTLDLIRAAAKEWAEAEAAPATAG